MSGKPLLERRMAFLSASAERRMQRQLAAIRADNRRRRPCPHCGLAVLPETMARHWELAHGEDGE